MKIKMSFSLFFIVTLFFAGYCAAEPNTKNQTSSSKSSQSGKVIEFKQLTLQGTVQRPSAAYLMQRRKLKFKGLVPKKSFISEIKKSVTKPPF